MQSQENKYYIHPDNVPPDDRVAVLKHGDTFGVFNRFGDIHGAQGIFHEDTRYLSALSLRLGRHRPLLLSSDTEQAHASLSVHLTNPDMELEKGELLPRGTLHLLRSKFLWDGVCHELIQLFHYGSTPVSVPVVLGFDADFVDIFEVRGMRRERRGVLHEPARDGEAVVMRYDGLDQRTRTTRIAFNSAASAVRAREIEFTITLQPGTSHELCLAISCDATPRAGSAQPVDRDKHVQAQGELSAGMAAARRTCASVHSSSVRFSDWVARCFTDLHMMTSDTAEGPYPYAGVPWYSTPFGRDGIITALQTLWVYPSLSRGVLRFLAATQSTTTDAKRAAEPGKILHELRKGEMSNLGEVPFGRYYGTVDATPLYVMLAGDYHKATGDRALIEEIWPNLERALAWIEKRGDRDGDGFVEYAGDPAGLTQQGWKDSSDSVFHDDGSDAPGPIALCEVQAYVYGAYRAAEHLSRLLGDGARAEYYQRKALTLQEIFDQRFWQDDLGTYALALDGDKRPCRVRTSNAGHCLYTGIVPPGRAARLARTLLEPNSFSGWGIRTLAAGEARYNPMSYHNGSIWPHDNAIVAAGLARYGFRHEALRVLEGLFEASLHFANQRLPELFCGFERQTDQGPTLYPVACSPQAWASGAGLLLLQACLGLTVDAPARELRFSHPILPSFVRELELGQLCVGGDKVDLIVHRYPEDVGINVVARSGPVRVINIK
jgi:glycogen debranching enzyme